MSSVLMCLTTQHDLRLVILAGIVCILGSIVSLTLVIRACRQDGAHKLQWLLLAGFAAGASVWSTHFLAMLAYEPGPALGFEPVLTALSFLIAVACLSGGLMLATRDHPFVAAAGGAAFGLGVAAMHYTGMMAVQAAGRVTWDATLVVTSIVIGTGLAAFALHHLAHSARRYVKYEAALLLVLAIVGLHFTAMGAVGIVPDPSVVLPAQAIPNTLLALAIAVVSLLVIGIGFVVHFIDERATVAADRRLKTLANAAMEGLVVTRAGIIVDVNDSFEEFSGFDRGTLVGCSLFDDVIEVDPAELAGDVVRCDCELVRLDGSRAPIELLSNAPKGGGSERIFAVRDLSEKRADERRINYLAHFDVLTSLPNRVAFLEHVDGVLQASQRDDLRFALVCMDFDHFKDINDVFGHGVGDQTLTQIARRIADAQGEGEFVARLGGDEFVGVRKDVENADAALEFAERLMKAVSARMEIDGNDILPGASIGIAMFPGDGSTVDELLANADLAMYRAKESVGGKICFFERDMDEQVRRRRALGADLRDALAREELEVHYQVQTLVATSEPVGYEALLRWRHPVRGEVSPSEFIPIAEENGLIIPLGTWVMRTACRDASAWPEHMRVAVNLSPVQFLQPNLAEIIHSILIETGLSPKRLEIEITETAVISDMTRALHTLRRVKALGISIAMDDFGTGYSSLSTLQAFPFDKIKIDRSFVAKLGDSDQAASIVRAILALGRSLNIPVLAEGIEQERHLEFLRAEGCTEAQGYLLGRPMSLARLHFEPSEDEDAQKMFGT